MEKINAQDIQTMKDKNIIDVDGLQVERLFLYQITNHKDKGFIKEKTISVLHLKPFKTIDAVRNAEEKSIKQRNIQNKSKGNTSLLSVGSSEMSYSTEMDITTDNKDVLIATKEPLVINNGKANTTMYFVDDTTPSLIRGVKIHGKKGLQNETDFILNDVNDIEGNYESLLLLYTFSEKIIKPTKTNITFDNYTLLSKVMAKGIVDGKKHQDIDLDIDKANSSKLSLLTMTPVSTNYKLSMFSHWLDANRTLPFVKAKTYIISTNLKTLFDSTNKDFVGWSAKEIADMYKVVISMMKLTKAYANNFTEYRGTDGKIKGDAKINGISLIDFADKTPINAVDGLMEKWKGDYPGQVDSAGFKISLEVIAMLSNHINSTYAVAKGNNDFHKVYLPWYFVPQTAITSALADDADFNVILKSEYFDLTATNPLEIKKEFEDISGYVAHDLNGWISQPELPNNLIPINKFARPGDISTKSDEDLKYLFYIPFNDEQILENLYGELHTSKQTGWHDEGITRRFIKHISGSGLINPTVEEAKRNLKLSLDQRLIVGSIKNVVNKNVVNKSGSYYCYDGSQYNGIGKCYSSWVEYDLEFDYQIQINGSQTISSIQHKGTIFDKLNWRSVCNSLTNGNDRYTLKLIPTHKFTGVIEEIQEINIQAIWNDNIDISITSSTDSISFTNIQLPTVDDETISNITILL